jgi:opine dehydrogenase
MAARSQRTGVGIITYTGALRGQAEIEIIDKPRALADYETLVIALPGYAYPDVLPQVLPVLQTDQTLIFGGALSLAPLWIYERARDRNVFPLIVGWGTTLATARRSQQADVEINTIRARFEAAALPATRGAPALERCVALFGDRVTLVDNMLVTALSNVNPVAHAAQALTNLTRMERGEHWLLFDCLTPAAARICEAIDHERIAIARALGLTVRSIEEHYRLSYHVTQATVADIARAIHARDGAPPGPKTLEHRYILEDMPYGLAVYERLAAVVNVPVPVMSAAITLAQAAYGRDFRRENALLCELGIDRLRPAQLLARCAGT